jgi:hypothetical protein
VVVAAAVAAGRGSWKTAAGDRGSYTPSIAVSS